MQIEKEIGSKNQIYKEIRFQTATFAHNFQIYKKIENLQSRPFVFSFSNV